MTDIIYRSKSALIQFISDNCTNLSASNNITAGFFYGDGSLLQNVTGSGGGGGGDVSVSGTPSNNEIPTWTNSTTIKGEGNLTFDGTTLALAGNETIITSNTGLTNDRALLVQNTADHCNIEVDAAANKDPNIILSENTTVKWSMGNDNSTDNLRFRNAAFTSTVAELTQTGNFQIDGDLTVSGNDIKDSGAAAAITFDGSQNVGIGGSPASGLKLDVKGALRTTDFMEVSGNLGLKDDLIFGAPLGISNIIDSLGNVRIYIDSGAHMSLVDRLGTANLVVKASYLQVPTELHVASAIVHDGDLDTLINFSTDQIDIECGAKPRIKLDGTGVGLLGATPIDGLAVTGDIQASGDSTINGALTVSTAGSTIAQEAWTAVSYATGWADYSVSYLGVSYMKDSLGFIHIRGMAKKTSGGTGLVFTLPSGYRPANRLIFNVQYYDLGATAYVHGRVDVLTNGQVTVVNPTPGVNDWVSFGAINFDTRAEP